MARSLYVATIVSDYSTDDPLRAPLYEESFVPLYAESAEEAWRRADAKAAGMCVEYENDDGRTVRVSARAVAIGNALGDELADGVEFHARHFRNIGAYMRLGFESFEKGAPEIRTTTEDLLRAARRGLRRLEPQEAAAAVEQGALLLDIRSELQRARDGVVPGALFHPRNVLEWRADPTCDHRDPDLACDLARMVVVVCDEGFQSSLAAATLREIGYARATDLVGGFQAWRAAGLPTASL